MMIAETAAGSEEADRIQASAKKLVEGRSLMVLREDMQGVS